MTAMGRQGGPVNLMLTRQDPKLTRIVADLLHRRIAGVDVIDPALRL
jgi:hypothetical protein